MESGGTGVSSKQKGKLKWSSLHHEVWRVLRKNLSPRFKKCKFLVCVSGGADSIALFYVMKDLPIDLEVFHAHHGPGENVEFRNQGQDLVRKICEAENISLHMFVCTKKMKSENEFRKFRLNSLKKWNLENPSGIIVTAHHAQDLLETRMMRLIRGTGPQGLRSMKVWKKPFLRPFLEMNPILLKDFLKENKIQWCEDPSNQNTRYFRNWIRHRWLPILEKAKPGSLKRLALSLDHLSTEGEQLKSIFVQETIRRQDYMALNQKDQIQHLALLLKSQGLSQFTSGQLKEVQKQLDNSKVRLMFKAAGALWIVNAQRILVNPL